MMMHSISNIVMVGLTIIATLAFYLSLTAYIISENDSPTGGNYSLLPEFFNRVAKGVVLYWPERMAEYYLIQ